MTVLFSGDDMNKRKNTVKHLGFLIYKPSTDEYLKSLTVSSSSSLTNYSNDVNEAYLFVSEDFANMVSSKLHEKNIVVPIYDAKNKYLVAFPMYLIEPGNGSF
jgi:hypothetical protein